MKIYIDLILIQDTIMISLILYILSKIIGIKIKIVRILIVSMFSSIISILILILLPTLYDNLLVKIILSYLTVKYGFNYKNTVETWQKVILFWTFVFLIGGATYFSDRNIMQVILMMGIVIISIISFKRKTQKKMLLESTICFLNFCYEGREYHFKALVDTGHDVKSIYGENVIFIRSDLWEEGGDKHKRLVRYQTISGMECKMGMKIKDISITYGNKTGYGNAVIVSTPNISQEFDAIVGYDFMEGGMMNGNIGFDETKSKETIH